MSVRRYHPTTPGRRHSSVNDYAELSPRTKPHKSSLQPIKKSAGRNFQGRITVRHRGGGNKRHYRQIDWQQRRTEPAKVVSLEYDPNRTAFIALIEYPDKTKSYILAPMSLSIGRTVSSSSRQVEILPGNRTQLVNIPTGMQIYNVELAPGRGGAIIRSAGTAATLMSIEGDEALVKMPSGEIRKVPKTCMASIGQVSNVEHANIRWGKAGRLRWFGIRPTVRGKAMNPVDHPHGGGEGHNPIGMKYPKTPWGKHALGVKTRRAHKYSDHLIVSRRPK